MSSSGADRLADAAKRMRYMNTEVRKTEKPAKKLQAPNNGTDPGNRIAASTPKNAAPPRLVYPTTFIVNTNLWMASGFRPALNEIVLDRILKPKRIVVIETRRNNEKRVSKWPMSTTYHAVGILTEVAINMLPGLL